MSGNNKLIKRIMPANTFFYGMNPEINNLGQHEELFISKRPYLHKPKASENTDYE